MDGARAKAIRKELNLSAQVVADLLGTTRATVSRWEKGETEPNDATKFELAKVLKTSVAYLIGETDNPTPINAEDVSVIVKANDPSKKKKISSEPRLLTFRRGEVSIEMPDTPDNKKLFDEFLGKIILKGTKK